MIYKRILKIMKKTNLKWVKTEQINLKLEEIEAGEHRKMSAPTKDMQRYNKKVKTYCIHEVKLSNILLISQLTTLTE